MTEKKKHFIGFGLFLLMLVFYYSYSKVIFSFNNESSTLFEGIFLSVFLCFLIVLAFFYIKNDLIVENIILAIFTSVFANPIALELIYYPIYVFFEGTSTLDIIDEYFYDFLYPFDIFYSNIMYLIPLIFIIPLTSLTIIFIKRHKKIQSANS